MSKHVYVRIENGVLPGGYQRATVVEPVPDGLSLIFRPVDPPVGAYVFSNSQRDLQHGAVLSGFSVNGTAAYVTVD